MEIKTAIERFLEEFRSSKEFQEYPLRKERVKEIPGLAEKINHFRKNRFEIQKYSGDDLFERIDIFEKEYRHFEEDPIVRDYLAAELEICRRIQELSDAVIEIVDIDLEEM